MSDKDFVVVVAVILMVLQFLYRLWDKKDNKAVLEAITAGLKSFDPHLDMGKHTHSMIEELKNMHDVKDEDGRIVWYMPKELIDNQRDIVKLTHTLATTQKSITALLSRMEERDERYQMRLEDKIDAHQERLEGKIDAHQANCQQQFQQLDKKTEHL